MIAGLVQVSAVGCFVRSAATYNLCTSLISRRNCCVKMSKRACLLIANGSEEMESVITVDVLRRGGVSVDLASVDVNDGPVKCSRDVSICPDLTLKEAMNNTYDMIVMPGGLKGSEAFCKSKEVGKFLQEQEKADRFIAAICAAPTALKAHSIHVGKSLTSYPAMADTMKCDNKYKYLEDKVVCDGKLITSRGPGTAIRFALTLVDKLMGAEKARETAKAMLLEYEPCC